MSKSKRIAGQFDAGRIRQVFTLPADSQLQHLSEDRRDNGEHHGQDNEYDDKQPAALVFIFAAFLSPLFLNWRWILIGVLGYYLQIPLFGGCLLTKFQFKGKQKTR